MARSVIFLATPTSSNGSMFRSLSIIGQQHYRPLAWVADFWDKDRMEAIRSESPPADDHLVKHNAPERFNTATRLSDYRFILNTRDPRDLLCNQFHWQFVHPILGEAPEQAERRRQRIREAGIDQWVLEQDFRPLLQGFLNVARRIAPPDRIFIGYAMYCLHFDEITERAAAFLDCPLKALPTERRAALERERVENLPGNSKWIGHSWPGADTAPGRHRQELRRETISILNQRYAVYLDFLRRMDDPRMAHHYE